MQIYKKQKNARAKDCVYFVYSEYYSNFQSINETSQMQMMR